MKGRPNNFPKHITRSKSPALPPAFSFPLPPKPPADHPLPVLPELARLGSADAKLRLSSPQPPREAKKSERGCQVGAVGKGGMAEGGVRPAKMEGLVKKDEDDNTTEQSSSQHLSYVTGEYQLDAYDMFSKRKNVKFQESAQELQRVGKVRCSGGKTSSRNSSILKNSSRVLDRSLASSDKSLSIQNSFTATRKCKIGLNTLQDNGNVLVRRKFEGIVEQMRGRSGQNKERYIDELFPPVEASIFSTSMHRKGVISRGKDEIVWMRLSEVFPHANKVFSRSKSHAGMVITRGQKNYAQAYFASSFNAIKGNTELLQFMFEREEVSQYGVYLVKIYMESAWKYVIVDDLVPCIRRRSKKEERFSPVFINVSGCEQSPLLWPFLLEKAYANYYSCYQNLCWGNPIDFVAELTGVAYREIQVSNKKIGKQAVEKHLASLGTFFMSGNPIALGWNEDRSMCYPISLLRQTFVGQSIVLGLHDPANNYDPLRLQLNQLPSLVSSVYLYAFGEYPSFATCPVYPPKLTKERVRKPKDEKARYLQIPPNDTTSLRTFTVFKKSKYCVNVRQKEIRFYSQCGITEYLWVRCLFLQKEYDGGFRWVGGRYSNEKHIIFEEQLQPGEYYLVITVQWRERYNKELSVMLYSESEFLKFQRRNYNKEERLVEMACMDLAQRYGKLNQINKSICSYTLLCQDTGLIIENIVNERTKGEVTIMRSINGLKSRVEILPLNVEFQVDAPEEYGALEKGQKRRMMTQSIEIDIQKGESFTVVLRMRGGIDRKFFKVFNFG